MHVAAREFAQCLDVTPILAIAPNPGVLALCKFANVGQYWSIPESIVEPESAAIQCFGIFATKLIRVGDEPCALEIFNPVFPGRNRMLDPP